MEEEDDAEEEEDAGGAVDDQDEGADDEDEDEELRLPKRQKLPVSDSVKGVLQALGKAVSGGMPREPCMLPYRREWHH